MSKKQRRMKRLGISTAARRQAERPRKCGTSWLTSLPRMAVVLASAPCWTNTPGQAGQCQAGCPPEAGGRPSDDGCFAGHTRRNSAPAWRNVLTHLGCRFGKSSVIRASHELHRDYSLAEVVRTRAHDAKRRAHRDIPFIIVYTKPSLPSLSVAIIAIPHCPGCPSAAEDVVEILLFLERIHARPKALMGIGHQFAFVNEALERRLDQLFAGVNVIENLLPKTKNPPLILAPDFPICSMLFTAPSAPCRPHGNWREALHSQSRLYSRCS